MPRLRRKHNFTLTEEQRAEIETALLTAEPHVSVRLRCLLLCAEAKPTPEVAGIVGDISDGIIRRWMAQYKKFGLTYLLKLKSVGKSRTPSITEEVFEKILEISQRSPSEFGFSTEEWTYQLLRDVCFDQGLIPDLTAQTIGLMFRKYGAPSPVSVARFDYGSLFSSEDLALLERTAENQDSLRRLKAKVLLLAIQGKKNSEIVDQLYAVSNEYALHEGTVQTWKTIARKRGVAFLLR